METEHADQFLIEQIRKGDQPAWRSLITRYEGRLTAYARLRTASVVDAEDLVQETFIGLANSLTHFDAARSLETYLFSILRYKICDQLRQRRIAAVHAPADNEDWWDQVLPGDTKTPSEIALHAEATGRLEAMLAEMLRQLIVEMRDRRAFDDLQVIELVFYKGMRNLDVGALLEIDQKAVAGIKFRAIQRLHRFLEDHDDAAPEPAVGAEADVTVARIWRQHRLTCLKRGTLGSYLLGVLEEPWHSYTQFHLDVVGCPMCLANLEDMEAEREETATTAADQIFQSSVGFLSRAGGESGSAA
ncbi:MAG: sigma-70 family RNA polymerase sigma factor [Phycisphaerales bacterium]|nr:sigma-70 family RNA polymerase sigma factor [Phycisphaerales bacterium]